MKLLINLTCDQVLNLIHNKRLSEVAIVPINSRLMQLLQEYVEENTGYDTPPVIGVTKVLGEEGLEGTWDSLSTIIPFKKNDFVLEFSMPNDLCTTIPYSDFLKFNYESSFLPEKVLCRLKNEEHCGDENEIAICPLILLKHCTRFTIIKENWDKKSVNFEDSSQLMEKSNLFGGEK